MRLGLPRVWNTQTSIVRLLIEPWWGGTERRRLKEQAGDEWIAATRILSSAALPAPSLKPRNTRLYFHGSFVSSVTERQPRTRTDAHGVFRDGFGVKSRLSRYVFAPIKCISPDTRSLKLRLLGIRKQSLKSRRIKSLLNFGSFCRGLDLQEESSITPSTVFAGV